MRRILTTLIVIGIIAIFVTPPIHAQEINMGGFMKTLYTMDLTENVPDNFTTPWVDLCATGELNELISYRFEYKFSPITEGLYFAYLNLKFSPYAALRVGQFAMPFGKNWYTYPTDILTPDYSIATAMLWAPGEEAAGVSKGAQISGSFGEAIGLNYYAAIFTPESDVDAYAGAGMIEISPMEGIMLGASYHKGEFTPLKEERTFIDGYGTINMYGFDVRGEYIGGKIEDKEKLGWYGTVAYTFEMPEEYLGSSISIQPVVRYSNLDPNKDVDDDEATRIEAGVNLYYGEHFKFQLFYEINGETPDVDNNRIYAQAQLTFGPGLGIW